MPNDATTNKGYPLPELLNTLRTDLTRIRNALQAIDEDVFSIGENALFKDENNKIPSENLPIAGLESVLAMISDTEVVTPKGLGYLDYQPIGNGITRVNTTTFTVIGDDRGNFWKGRPLKTWGGYSGQVASYPTFANGVTTVTVTVALPADISGLLKGMCAHGIARFEEAGTFYFTNPVEDLIVSGCAGGGGGSGHSGGVVQSSGGGGGGFVINSPVHIERVQRVVVIGHGGAAGTTSVGGIGGTTSFGHISLTGGRVPYGAYGIYVVYKGGQGGEPNGRGVSGVDGYSPDMGHTGNGGDTPFGRGGVRGMIWHNLPTYGGGGFGYAQVDYVYTYKGATPGASGLLIIQW